MANYTITRHTESGHVYGCTDFSTIQEEGQIASNGAPLDSTIVWDLKANTGYSVTVDNFEFVGGTIVTANNPLGTYVWKDLPSPILGATMEQISSILIRITLYLAPSSSYPGFNTGGAFVMPASDVDTTVNIEGCTKLAGEGQHIVVETPNDPKTKTRMDISEDLKNNMVANVVSDEREELSGTLPPREENGDDKGVDTLLMSYQVVAEDGYRYKITPNLSFTDKNYYTKKRITKQTNPLDSTKKDVTSVSFDVYKKNN